MPGQPASVHHVHPNNKEATPQPHDPIGLDQWSPHMKLQLGTSLAPPTIWKEQHAPISYRGVHTA
jgi:hypothetical protein